MLTDQELFDKVSTHLLTQMETSFSRDGECAYRGQNGLKCAIGCLIDDDWYQETFEGSAPVHLDIHSFHYAKNEAFLAELTKRVSTNLELMNDLQKIHDNEEPKDWQDELVAVAEAYGLRGPTAD